MKSIPSLSVSTFSPFEDPRGKRFSDEIHTPEAVPRQPAPHPTLGALADLKRPAEIQKRLERQQDSSGPRLPLYPSVARRRSREEIEQAVSNNASRIQSPPSDRLETPDETRERLERQTGGAGPRLPYYPPVFTRSTREQIEQRGANPSPGIAPPSDQPASRKIRGSPSTPFATQPPRMRLNLETGQRTEWGRSTPFVHDHANQHLETQALALRARINGDMTTPLDLTNKLDARCFDAAVQGSSLVNLREIK